MKPLLATVAILVVACSGPPPSDRVAASPGKRAFRSYCASCHTLPKPSSQTDEEWVELVAKYGTKAKLSETDIELITSYLQETN